MKVSSSFYVVHSVPYEALKLWDTIKCTIPQCHYSFCYSALACFGIAIFQGAYAKISLKHDCEGSCLSMYLSPSTHHMGAETNLDPERNVCKQLIGMQACTSFNHSKKQIILSLY